MRITKQTQKTVTDLVDIFCNKCGKSCKDKDTNDFYGLIEIQVDGGYYSTALEDCTTYTFSLCEPCLVGYMEMWKHPPDKFEYTPTVLSEIEG